MECFSEAKKPHAVIMPLPYQSHINAMLKLAKILQFKGFHITFVNTEFNHQKVLNSRGSDSLNGLPDFRFVTIPDGLPPSDINATQDMTALWHSITRNCLIPLRNLITELNKASASGDPQVSCIVADAFLSVTVLEAAEEFAIPGVLLWTMSASVLMSYLYYEHTATNVIFPLKGI
ncbi:hypothetical protein AQUCO_01600022v1 [Aquilegia coerulea]|uniref:Glycosyltransferase N-terminal domain-containing protein n=1 Tax=Aquilegia coerulea TaxID=218851 RepID=A0A2G5DPW8_AQUCA|nr:hypothetical protein AQUCO_01600022v1 [Aquilegia coerulea]